MMEIWKDIEHGYKISNLGRVMGKNGVLKNRLSKNGYHVVSIGSNYKFKNQYVHRLVGKHFLVNNNNYKVINHIDGDKTNNKYTNLEWSTYSKNTTHAHDNNLIIYKNKSSKYTGVYLHKGSGKWISRLNMKYLGSFDTEEDAHLSYKKEREKCV